MKYCYPLCLALLCCAAACRKSGTITPLTTDAFQTLLNDHPNLGLLDVRSPENFLAGHLPRAINWPYYTWSADNPAFVRNADALDRSLPLAVYCADGLTSPRAAEKLQEMGFQQIYWLQGGMITWKERLERF